MSGAARVLVGLSPVQREGPLTHLAAANASPRPIGEPADRRAGRITVVLGRFDALVAHGLRQILCEDRNLRIIGSDLDHAGLEDVAESRVPQVAIIDETTVFESSVLKRLRIAQPTIGIVVLIHRPTVADGMRLFAGGASCLSKEVSAADILAAVYVTADGRRVFAAADGHLVERNYPVTATPLTPREAEVLEYLSRGQSHAEIANALQLGVETIRTHSASIRRKLGVRTKRELIGIRTEIR
jgi:DNA-binding NarL/FixJ family response regulator